MNRIAYVGMTHLGLNSAVAAAALGCEVVCFDNDPAHIAALSAGQPHVLEPQLQELMLKHAERLHFTHQLADLNTCQLVTIAPDVPTDDSGNSDLGQLRVLIQQVDESLPASAVLVVLSQVPPGFSRALSLKEDRHFYCQVETLIFGQAVERAMQPERIIIGCAHPQQPLAPAYQHFLNIFNCPLLPMAYESAELAKIAINCFLVASISATNTLAELCEHNGAVWSEIVPALRHDKRIGPHAYLTPGLGIAGGNLERDLNTVITMADLHGTDTAVVSAWISNSRYRKKWVLRLLHQQIFPHMRNPRIALWGLAYKQDTHSTKNSPALALLDSLGTNAVAAYDPAVTVASLSQYANITQASDPVDACRDADVLVIMTPWPAFAAVPLAEIAAAMKGRWLIDPYRVLAAQNPQDHHFTYLNLGSPIGE